MIYLGNLSVVTVKRLARDLYIFLVYIEANELGNDVGAFFCGKCGMPNSKKRIKNSAILFAVKANALAR